MRDWGSAMGGMGGRVLRIGLSEKFVYIGALVHQYHASILGCTGTCGVEDGLLSGVGTVLLRYYHQKGSISSLWVMTVSSPDKHCSSKKLRIVQLRTVAV